MFEFLIILFALSLWVILGHGVYVGLRILLRFLIHLEEKPPIRYKSALQSLRQLVSDHKLPERVFTEVAEVVAQIPESRLKTHRRRIPERQIHEDRSETPEGVTHFALEDLASVSSSGEAADHQGTSSSKPVNPFHHKEPVVVVKTPGIATVLRRFLESHNIHWIEILGALLILGGSTGLAVSFWSEIADHPGLRVLLFAGVNIAILTFGWLSGSRWSMGTTGVSLSLTGVALIPITQAGILSAGAGTTSPSLLSQVFILSALFVLPAVAGRSCAWISGFCGRRVFIALAAPTLGLALSAFQVTRQVEGITISVSVILASVHFALLVTGIRRAEVLGLAIALPFVVGWIGWLAFGFVQSQTIVSSVSGASLLPGLIPLALSHLYLALYSVEKPPNGKGWTICAFSLAIVHLIWCLVAAWPANSWTAVVFLLAGATLAIKVRRLHRESLELAAQITLSLGALFSLRSAFGLEYVLPIIDSVSVLSLAVLSVAAAAWQHLTQATGRFARTLERIITACGLIVAGLVILKDPGNPEAAATMLVCGGTWLASHRRSQSIPVWSIGLGAIGISAFTFLVHVIDLPMPIADRCELVLFALALSGSGLATCLQLSGRGTKACIGSALFISFGATLLAHALFSLRVDTDLHLRAAVYFGLDALLMCAASVFPGTRILTTCAAVFFFDLAVYRGSLGLRDPTFSQSLMPAGFAIILALIAGLTRLFGRGMNRTSKDNSARSWWIDRILLAQALLTAGLMAIDLLTSLLSTMPAAADAGTWLLRIFAWSVLTGVCCAHQIQFRSMWLLPAVWASALVFFLMVLEAFGFRDVAASQAICVSIPVFLLITTAVSLVARKNSTSQVPPTWFVGVSTLLALGSAALVIHESMEGGWSRMSTMFVASTQFLIAAALILPSLITRSTRFAAAGWIWALVTWITLFELAVGFDGSRLPVDHLAAAALATGIAAIVLTPLRSASRQFAGVRAMQPLGVIQPFLLVLLALLLGLLAHTVSDHLINFPRHFMPLSEFWLIFLLVGLPTIALMLVWSTATSREPAGSWSVRGRVFLGEFTLVSCLMLVRATKPEWFSEHLLHYWPFGIISAAWMLLYVSRAVRRLGLELLDEPFEWTAAALLAASGLLCPHLGAAVSPASTLLLVGLSSLGFAAITQKTLYACLGLVALNGAYWSLLSTKFGFSADSFLQMRLIPLGLSLFAAEIFFGRSLSPRTISHGRWIAALVIYGSAGFDVFWSAARNGVATEPLLPVLLAVYAIVGVFSGLGLKRRALVVSGFVALLLALLTMIWCAGEALEWTWIWYAFGLLSGLGLIAVWAFVERERDLVERWIQRIATWES